MSPILCRIESSPAKPAPPARPATLLSSAAAGVHQPSTSAGLVSRSGSRNTWPAPSPPPGSERPRRYHLGAGSVHAGLRMTNWFGGGGGGGVTRAGQEIYFEEEQCVSRSVTSVPHFMWSTVREWLAPCALIPVPKTLEQGGGSLWSPQCQSVYLRESPEIWLD